MNFSTNQVMQFFVHDNVDSAVAVAEAKKLPNGGFSIPVKKGDAVIGRTDVIENVKSATLAEAADLVQKPMEVTLTMDEVVAGQDYIVRIKYPEIAGLGVEGYTTKTAAYTAKTGDTAQVVLEAIADAFATQFAADGILTAEYKEGLVITQTDPTVGYKRGVRPVVLVDFEVSVAPIIKEGEEVADWATKEIATVAAGLYVKNGYKLADMEYFAMGERGDQYRMMGWPDVIDTEYLINPKGEYDVINIHFAHADNNTTFQEKDLVIACVAGTGKTVALALIAKGVDVVNKEGKTVTE